MTASVKGGKFAVQVSFGIDSESHAVRIARVLYAIVSFVGKMPHVVVNERGSLAHKFIQWAE